MSISQTTVYEKGPAQLSPAGPMGALPSKPGHGKRTWSMDEGC
jgi:hypothetical protein